MGEVSQEEKERIINYYAEKKGFLGTFDECYELYGKDWNDNVMEKDENGIWNEFSTYNPNSKWDWFIIGGRWSGFFKMKPNVIPVIGEPGAFNNVAKSGYGDVAMKKDIDFDGMKNDDGVKSGELYDEIISIIGNLPESESWNSVCKRLEINEARVFYHTQPRMVALTKANKHWACPDDFNCTREEYVERARMRTISTYAIVKDGVWYQKGDMGWWGMASNEMSEDEWNQKVNELIDSVPDDTLFTLVDAHI